MIVLRFVAFLGFALFVGLFSPVTRRLRARRARGRWKLTSSSYLPVTVGACRTLREVHDTYGTLGTQCPFCATVQRPRFRRTQLGPLVLDWYATPPATEALPDDEDDDEEDGGTSGPFLVG